MVRASSLRKAVAKAMDQRANAPGHTLRPGGYRTSPAFVFILQIFAERDARTEHLAATDAALHLLIPAVKLVSRHLKPAVIELFILIFMPTVTSLHRAQDEPAV